MASNIQKYELSQNGKTYILTTQIQEEKVKLICIEDGVTNPRMFVGEFSLSSLSQLSPLFQNITLIQAQEIINQTVENQKVSVEPQGEVLNLILYLTKEAEFDDSFLVKMGLSSKGVIYKEPIIYHSQIEKPPSPVRQLPTKIINSKSETVAQSVYSPVQRLPDKHINIKADSQNIQEIYTSNSYGNLNNYNIYDNTNLNSINQYDTNIYGTSAISTTELNNYQTQEEDYSKYFNQYATTQTQSQTQYQQYPTVETSLPYITPVNDQIYYSSPKREQIQYEMPGSPSTAHITFSVAPSHKQEKIIETTKTTTTQHYNPLQSPRNDMSIYNQKINDLQNETNRIRGEYNMLRSESTKLSGEVGQLRGQIHVLLEENKVLRQKNGSTLNDSQIHEISILKQENESLRSQLNQNIAIQNTFEQYKQLKEEEIKYLKLQIEELLKTQKKLEQIVELKQKEIDELKRQNEELFKNYNIVKEQKNLTFQKQGKLINDSMKNQSLTIQDTRLEVVKGDIIKSTEELELLTRKICKKYKKVVLDLLYKATIDSDKASAFHNKCDSANRTLILIQIGNGRRFGGYTTCSWKGESLEKKDDNAFIFSLDEMKIYDIIPGEDAIGCYPRYGPVFLGCQIRIYDNFFTRGGTTFERGVNFNTQEDYELSGGLKSFDVKEIEVYSVILE